MDSLANLIIDYYNKRHLTWPNFDNAMKFVQTELAEVYEIDLDRSGNWVRNHPENKPKFDKEALAEELGDAIFMLVVAGLAEGVDPITAMKNKMERKLEEVKEEINKLKGRSQLEILIDQEVEDLMKHE